MQEYIETYSDSFVDYAGNVHHFVIAAISKNFSSNVENKKNCCEIDRYVVCGFEESVVHVVKGVSLGYSICNPKDNFNEELGILKATYRAKANTPVLFSTNKDVINQLVVKALLKQEAEYLKSNPEKFIKRHNQMKLTYLKNKTTEEFAKNLSSPDYSIIEIIDKFYY